MSLDLSSNKMASLTFITLEKHIKNSTKSLRHLKFKQLGQSFEVMFPDETTKAAFLSSMSHLTTWDFLRTPLDHPKLKPTQEGTHQGKLRDGSMTRKSQLMTGKKPSRLPCDSLSSQNMLSVRSSSRFGIIDQPLQEIEHVNSQSKTGETTEAVAQRKLEMSRGLQLNVQDRENRFLSGKKINLSELLGPLCEGSKKGSPAIAQVEPIGDGDAVLPPDAVEKSPKVVDSLVEHPDSGQETDENSGNGGQEQPNHDGQEPIEPETRQTSPSHRAEAGTTAQLRRITEMMESSFASRSPIRQATAAVQEREAQIDDKPLDLMTSIKKAQSSLPPMPDSSRCLTSLQELLHEEWRPPRIGFPDGR